MNTTTDLKSLIYLCYKDNKLEELISLFLCLNDAQDSPWVIINPEENLQEKLEHFQSFSQNDYKFHNDKILKRIKVSIVEIYLMPKNKRLSFIPYLEEYINELLDKRILVVDYVRFNPYKEDLLFYFILSNKDVLDKSLINLYESRSKDLKKLLDYAKFEKNFYESFYIFSKRIKVIDYWKNIWGDYKPYASENYGIVDHLVL